MDLPVAAALAADGATAACGAFNAAELAVRRRVEPRARRRTALGVLAAVNGGIALQSAFAFALFATHLVGAPAETFFAPGAWLASRVLLLAGTAAISALILRSRR